MPYDSRTKKRFKIIGGIALVGAIALQFVNPPPRDNPPVLPGHDLMGADAPPSEIAGLLKNSCYDCHSYETKWPWYSYIAPFSWLVARDVNAARAALNFSEWPHDDAARARKRWRHIADDVQSGEMPLANYMRMHGSAQLSERQRADLVKWASQQADPSAPAGAATPQAAAVAP